MRRPYRPKGHQLHEDDRLWLIGLVMSLGQVRAAEYIGVSRTSMLRGAAGFFVYAATIDAVSDARDRRRAA